MGRQKRFVQGRQKRFWEILPGATSWTILITPVILSLFYPISVAYFIICFDFYWLVKAVFMGGYLISGYLFMRTANQINWREECLRFANIAKLLTNNPKLIDTIKLPQKKFLDWPKDLKQIITKNPDFPDPDEIFHVVILPNFRDDYPIIQSAIKACKEANWPSKRIIINVALEAREGEIAKLRAAKLVDEFKNVFADLIITIHPDNIEGELKGKSANITWAGRVIKKYIEEKGIAPENVIVSALDGDTRVSKEYFGCLTYKYLTAPERTKKTYQPIPLFNNNIWEIPPINRIVAFGSSFWQMIESCRPHRLINFSSQAMSLKTLIDIDFWDTTIVSEDSKQYYRAFFRYSGNHKAIPLFTPVYMDAVSGKTLWQTLKNQYLQKRRWAYGVENFSYVMTEFPRHKEIPFLKKFKIAFRLFEGSVSWATASLLIAFAGWLPILLNPTFRSSILAYNIPVIASRLLTLAWIGVAVSTIIGLLLLPPRPPKVSKWKILEMVFQWILVPVSAIFYGSIPALDAQTRLMLGKYLGFWVTPKIRSEK